VGQLLASIKFKDKNVADVQAGVQALRASGARIFVYLEDTGNNIEALLLSAGKAKIAGQDGYAWVTFEQNDPETILKQATTQAATLRPLFFGWLNIFGYTPSATRLSRFQEVFAAADRDVVYNPVVNMPATGFVKPFLTAYHLYAYDSVWATALGLAHGPDTSTSHLVDRIRAADFVGASGRVAFDNTTGDRLSEGLQLRLQSVGADLNGQDFAAANWSTVRMMSKVIGYLEDEAGFVPAAGAVPTWPGGRASWTPPSDGSASGGFGVLLAEIIVPIVVTSMLVAVVLWCVCRREEEDDADRQLRVKVAELRAELRIQRADGYLVGGERPSMWARREPVGYLRKGYVEAAAKLGMWEDFDVKSVDALCVSLLGDEFSESNALDQAFSVTAPLAEQRQLSKEAYGRLCEWLLQLSDSLLDPGPKPSSPLQVFLEVNRSVGDDSVVTRSTTVGPQIRERTAGSLFNRLTSAGLHRPLEEPLSKASDPGRRFTFFVEKVSRLQIWRDDEALFRRLKEVVQRFMDDLARTCNDRYSALVNEPGGAELAAFHSRDYVPSQLSLHIDGYLPDSEQNREEFQRIV
jgi:hypothetical protein